MSRSRRELLRDAVAVLTAAAVSRSARVAAQSPERHRIEIADFTFQPRELILNVGDTVVWVNSDIAPHTATARDGSWHTGTLNRGEETAIVFPSPDHFDYLCQFHPMMKAHLIVKAPEDQGD
jgi:plastocyanin